MKKEIFLNRELESPVNLFNVRFQDLKPNHDIDLRPIPSFRVLLLVSHLWEAPTTPDPINNQIRRFFKIVRGFYKQNREISRKLRIICPQGRLTIEDWAQKCTSVQQYLQGIGVWYDYICLPQEDFDTEEWRDIQSKELGHLREYFKYANVLILDESGNDEEEKTYWERAWCVAEYTFATRSSICVIEESANNRERLREAEQLTETHKRVHELLRDGRLSTTCRSDLIKIALLIEPEDSLRFLVFTFLMSIALAIDATLLEVYDVGISQGVLLFWFAEGFFLYGPRFNLRFRETIVPWSKYSPVQFCVNLFFPSRKRGIISHLGNNLIETVVTIMLTSFFFMFGILSLIDGIQEAHFWDMVGGLFYLFVGASYLHAACGGSLLFRIRELADSRYKMWMCLFQLKTFLLILFSIRREIEWRLGDLVFKAQDFEKDDLRNLKTVFYKMCSALRQTIGPQEFSEFFAILKINFNAQEIEKMFSDHFNSGMAFRSRSRFGLTFAEFKTLSNLQNNSNGLLSEQETKDFQEMMRTEMFKIFDLKNQGKVEPSDVRKVLACFGFEISEPQALKIISEADRDVDDALTINEFRSLLKKYSLWL